METTTTTSTITAITTTESKFVANQTETWFGRNLYNIILATVIVLVIVCLLYCIKIVLKQRKIGTYHLVPQLANSDDIEQVGHVSIRKTISRQASIRVKDD